MTGPEHYREAEQLLTQGAREFLHPDGDPTHALAAAQVHATLALAAATAQAALVDSEHFVGMPRADVTAWGEAAGTKAKR